MANTGRLSCLTDLMLTGLPSQASQITHCPPASEWAAASATVAETHTTAQLADACCFIMLLHMILQLLSYFTCSPSNTVKNLLLIKRGPWLQYRNVRTTENLGVPWVYTVQLV